MLSLVGLTFLPADTLAEKAYVILACLALSLAAVTGIDAWRDAARFRLTAMSTVVAIVCLAALSMAAQREQPSPPAPQPSHAASLTTPSTSGSPAPTPSPTDLPSPTLTPTPSASSPASSGLTVHDGGATVTGCGLNTEGKAFANLSITNHTSANTTFYVYVGFYQGGNQFTDSVQTLTIGAGSTYLATIDSIATPPGQGTVSCKVLKLND